MFDAPSLAVLARYPEQLEALFDQLPDVMVYLKDTEARYRWANRTVVRLAGAKSREQVIGRCADELFPVTDSTTAQDLALIRSGQSRLDHLYLFGCNDGRRFWTLVSKWPLDSGLIGISRLLPHPQERHHGYQRMTQLIAYLEHNLDQSPRIAEAARQLGLSIDTLERWSREVFQLTPKQLLLRLRIERACRLLGESAQAITEIANACGYADHSAFTRQFRVATGLAPSAWRKVHRQGA